MAQIHAQVGPVPDMSDRSARPALALGEAGLWSATGAYGLAHFGKSLFWYSSEILFAFFLTEIGGLSPYAMGAVFASGLLSSVAIDLALAWALRGTLAHIGRAGALQMLGAVLSAAALALLFLTPWIEGTAQRFAFAAGAMLVFRFAYALYDLPQNVLVGLATASQGGRTRVATMRLFFSGLAALAVSAAVAPLVADPDAGERAIRFLVLAAGISVLALSTAWGLRRALRGRSAPGRPFGPPRADSSGSRARWPVAIPFLLAAAFITSLTTSLFNKLEPYFAAYVIGSPFWGGAMIVAVALGMTLSQPVWAVVSAHRSRPVMLATTAGLLIVSALAFLSTVMSSLWAGAAAAFFFGAANGGLGAIMWAAYGDAIAAAPARLGGMAFAVFTGASKVALALSGLMLAAFLHGLDYRDADREMILVAMTLWPAAGAAACLGLALLWMRRSRLG